MRTYILLAQINGAWREVCSTAAKSPEKAEDLFWDMCHCILDEFPYKICTLKEAGKFVKPLEY
jgi:hypothetical protein